MKNIEMKVGDKVPHCKFRVRSLGEWTDTNVDSLRISDGCQVGMKRGGYGI